ncbi:uncharacterized protein LOC108875464 [Lates calcarifer]|uniref:Uncharacterized protein LOC108875464 n=1 Tax=Lates calcarifer TaxID=8187 RepID=A0AAJ7LEQ4_LATCA|nr:uncharacterized protein LOC108875464 [Lates calcarifer]
MKVHHTLIFFFFFFALQDGNTGVIRAEIPVFKRAEGETITVKCHFSTTARKKYFCKDECKNKDILIKTDKNQDQSGRYNISFEDKPTGGGVLSVTIKQLIKSDSGLYGCGLDIALSIDPYSEFRIIVTNAPSTSKPTWTLRPVLTSAPTTAQSFRTSSTFSASSSQTTNQSEQQQTETTAGASGTDVLLYVGLTLAVTVILLLLGLLILCRKRANKTQEPPADTVYANVSVANRVYEEIREEDRRGRSPPVEVSIVYTQAKYSKANRAETTDDYSLVAATASSAGNKAEDDSSQLAYSEVVFSKRPVSSFHGAPCGAAEDVVYSVPRVGESWDGS